MSTNFMSLDDKVKESKETTFTKVLISGIATNTKRAVKEYKNILHIGYDEYHGDVFKCWNEDINCFKLYFGVKGDEFNK